MKQQGFYDRAAWKNARRAALERDGYLCQLRFAGCTRIADTVHHVQELEDRPDLALELDNLTSCCRSCHEQTKHRDKLRIDNTPIGVRVIKV